MPKTSLPAANLVTSGRAATTLPAAPGPGTRFLVRAHRSPPGASGTAGPPADATYPDEPAARTFTSTLGAGALRQGDLCGAPHAGGAVGVLRAGIVCRRADGGAVPPPFPAGAAARPAGPIAALMAVQARLSRGGSMVPSRRPQDDMRATDREQNPLVTEGERSTVRDWCCHMPPRLGCARSATEVQSSREEFQSRLRADKRAPSCFRRCASSAGGTSALADEVARRLDGPLFDIGASHVRLTPTSRMGPADRRKQISDPFRTDPSAHKRVNSLSLWGLMALPRAGAAGARW
jgi:hypothetical protein